MSIPLLVLRVSNESDIETFFNFQLNEEANFMAAFTTINNTDKLAYTEKWQRLMKDPTINMQTILYGDEIAGSVSKYEIEGAAEITYWIGNKFWGKGIASAALKDFLVLEKARPIRGRVAFDNFASKRVLEKNGFVQIGTDKGFANARGKEIEEFILRLD